ncbi:hypothetical protein HAHI6034_11125 [Hathewaya histolytica]|uniref:Uncharacterized protein n=1 Tax=Hathewaya histolytica TaxID=1498 RepID=A0A4U9RHZ0_HATHI|nr:Uncharacterised protein [Hathewaya histolytica]
MCKYKKTIRRMILVWLLETITITVFWGGFIVVALISTK